MPVTIRELIVRATVVDKNVSSDRSVAGVVKLHKIERDALMSDCVEKVLEILERQKER